MTVGSRKRGLAAAASLRSGDERLGTFFTTDRFGGVTPKALAARHEEAIRSDVSFMVNQTDLSFLKVADNGVNSKRLYPGRRVGIHGFPLHAGCAVMIEVV